MIDSHCHLDDPRMDASAAIARARDAGVERMVCVGYSPERWERQLALPVDLAFGLHPWAAGEVDLEPHLPRLEELLDRAVAVGEIGLDRSLPRETRELQEGAFLRQLDLARRKNLPVVLHIVRAHGRVLELLGEQGLPDAGGVAHSYCGSPEMVSRFLDLGLFIGFTAGVMKLKRAREVVRAVPLERLLLESDCPDQSPEPAALGEVARIVADLRGESPAVIERASSENATNLFHLTP